MKKQCLISVLAIFVFWVPPAMAYLDPGSGSAIMSAIIGFFVALSLVIKTFWYKLKSLFSSNKSKQHSGESETKNDS